jgi:hypothetical protein
MIMVTKTAEQQQTDQTDQQADQAEGHPFDPARDYGRKQHPTWADHAAMVEASVWEAQRTSKKSPEDVAVRLENAGLSVPEGDTSEESESSS